jgi:broad specificity phosphatase PhoE
MQLYLIRHGQSLVNLADWAHGNSDEGLTDLGRQQAQAVAQRLATAFDRIDVLYASTMRRARETATFVSEALDLPIQPDDRIREIGNNRLDHAPWPDVPSDYGDFWATSRPFASVTPGVEWGESLMHFRTRVGAFLEELRVDRAGQQVVAVTHGGVIDAVFDHVFNVGPWRHCQVWTSNASVTQVELLDDTSAGHGMAHGGPERWRLHRHNDVGHLDAVPSPAPVDADGASGQATQ